MKGVETIARIRREFFVRGKTIKEIVRELHVSRNMVRKVLRSGATEFTLRARGPAAAEAGALAGGPRSAAGRERGEAGARAADADPGLRGAARARLRGRLRRGPPLRPGWQRERAATSAAAYVPLSFAPGEAYQFDWSHEVVLINGTTVTVKVAHVRLCHSRMLFVRAYPRETQEMVFDAHDRAFAFFKGACTRGIYDNMKTAVETIFVGKERAYNRRFLQMCSHYLVDPVACTPASGWEKGQVENQVGLVRERFFTPAAAGEELRGAERLAARPVHRLRQGAPPSRVHATRRSGRCSRRSGRAWCPMPAASTASTPCRPRCRRPASCASTTTATRWRRSAVGRPVEIRAYAERIELRQDGRLVGEHPRCFGRDQTVFDPWHYVPVLARKPGALRNGAPFKDWVLPAGLERVRRKLAGAADGDRQMVDILTAVLSDGLPAVEAACQEALREGVHSADVILNILARRREPAAPITIMTPDALRLRHAPVGRLRPLRQPQESRVMERSADPGRPWAS